MVYVSNRTKTFNEQIYYAINSIQEGIFSGLEIHFKYYEYTVEKRKQLRHGGEVYTVSPYSLVWENDNYYLVCYCEKHEKICRYRVDRMTQVTVTDIPRRELSEEEKENAKKDMEEMLDYIDKLNELDTSGVEPMSHIFPVYNVFREDVVTNGDDRNNMLKNAPRTARWCGCPPARCEGHGWTDEGPSDGLFPSSGSAGCLRRRPTSRWGRSGW